MVLFGVYGFVFWNEKQKFSVVPAMNEIDWCGFKLHRQLKAFAKVGSMMTPYG